MLPLQSSAPTTTARGYRHFLFDFDGVLCDSLGQAIAAYMELRTLRFPELPPIASREDMTLVYAGPLKSCLDRWLSPEGTKLFFDLHSAAMAKRAPELSPFPGVGELLTGLPGGSVSIVTSAYSEAVRAVLAKDGVSTEDTLFRIAGRELKQTKTEKIRDILAASGCPGKAAVYVGDLESDILYCRAVPIDIVAVGYGYHPGAYLQRARPDYYVEDLAALRSLLCAAAPRGVSEVES